MTSAERRPAEGRAIRSLFGIARAGVYEANVKKSHGKLNAAMGLSAITDLSWSLLVAGADEGTC